ncbi:ACL008Cp [Eremothecium gossypii ATCC 10895]|uniref:DNA topoisomerase I n=1 Tax=Eremothecium gossypii (strain ATCC 10895 / CBS 109.51 / FGSC 9923 / NRRL Y-1056) TaxID=284811 RepID=Q75CB7_EREGS|nr:ACL008Cp [Eremothecium gossypii ATCC 10895]AAS51220.2 ACL008Cp [Eremothecium gossypii ATCC 10895]AEY95511.1 FACL008Cp [Eremothecium gossypii FDAG1]
MTVKLKNDSSSEDEPLGNGGRKAARPARGSKRRAVKEEESSSGEQEEVLSQEVKKRKTVSKRRAPARKVKEEEGDRDAKKESSVDGEEDSEEFKWWEREEEKDDSVKWVTLRHNGVMFPPEYTPLPSHVRLYYGGKAVELPAEAEEVAGFFAALLQSDHAQNPVFQKNFFEDFLSVLNKHGGARNGIDIQEFSKCDFSKMHAYIQQQKDQKKQLSSHEKKLLKQEKDKQEEPYKFCYLDGRKEQVGNFKIEPPDLFRGRGAHPKTGKLKRRVQPEDVVLNLDKDAPIPEPPAGHKWGEIRHDNTVQWLCMWRENISNSFKYVRLAANSSLKGMSDFKKFEKSRELKNYIDIIRADYRKNLKSKVMLDRQIAVATYLIDVFALRAGGEKSEDEADTVGCCSLRYEHISLKPPNTVVFDFLGKDSIRYYQEVEVDKQVFKNLSIFKRPPKEPGHQLFDRLDPSILNKHLQNYMPGLTAKVFRTYNASKTMQDQLDLIPNEGSVTEKMVRYNAANRAVAILCNHQRTVGRSHAQSMQKATEKIEEYQWQKIRYKKAILQLDESELKANPKFFKEINDLTKEEQMSIHKRVLEREREKYQKKFARENEKRKFEGEELLPESQLESWLADVEEMGKEYVEELETGLVTVKPTLQSVEKLKAQIDKLEQRIRTTSIQMKDKEDNSTVALSTSKISYIDPRLSVAFCKKYDVPLEKVFTKTLREKFKWAIESADENWRF